MRFKQFLESSDEGVVNDEQRTKVVEVAEAIEFFKKNPKAFDRLNDNDPARFLFRGQNSTSDIHIGDSREFTRKASATKNYMNLFVSSARSWREVANRTHAFITSTALKGTGGYGKPYVVFAADDAKVSTCNSYDFWDAFEFPRQAGRHMSVMTVNDVLDEAEEGLEVKLFDRNSSEKLRNTFRSLTKKVLTDFRDSLEFPHGDGAQAFDYLLLLLHETSTLNIEDALDSLIDPKVNKIKTSTGAQLEALLDGERREAWIEGEAILIKFSAFDTIRKEILQG